MSLLRGIVYLKIMIKNDNKKQSFIPENLRWVITPEGDKHGATPLGAFITWTLFIAGVALVLGRAINYFLTFF